MKLFTLLIFICLSNVSFSQNDTTVADTNMYRIIKTDNTEIIGKILKQDAREILVLTSDGRKIYIPQHVIKELIVVNKSDFNNKNQFIGEDKFATRYFITTNGLPIKKGEHYVQWNLFGPDFQFAVGENLGVGIMTSWFGMPIIGSIKRSFKLGPKLHFGLGGLVGTGSWAMPEFGGALPFATLSFGDRSANLAFSGGYGAIWDEGEVSGRGITSVAFMVKVSPKISIVFDSFILLPGKTTYETYTDYSGMSYTYADEKPGFALLIPGIRWHQDEGRAFQFGFTGVLDGNYGGLYPVPIPMVQWYRTL